MPKRVRLKTPNGRATIEVFEDSREALLKKGFTDADAPVEQAPPESVDSKPRRRRTSDEGKE